jgi:hypothetical protein
MRTSLRIWVSLAAWLMLMIGVEGTFAQAASVPEAAPAASSVAPPPLSRPPAPPSCPAKAITGSPTDQPPAGLERYYLDNWRLGPAELPQTGPVGVLLQGYHRPDVLGSSVLLGCYWDQTADNNGGWRYPSDGGFAGAPVTVTLEAGQVLDRFGSNSGRFLSPYGTAYAERALPPSNLDTFEPLYPNNYHIFRVLKPFAADGGTAAAWFGQPGGGIQYRLDDKYFPGEVVSPEHANTQWLITHQYLAPVN